MEEQKRKNGWNRYECQIGHRAAMVLINTSHRNIAPISELPCRMWVGIWCALPTEGAYWSLSESTRLDSIEDSLFKAFKTFKPGWALYVLRICSPGIRELYFYTDDSKDQDEIIGAVKAEFPKYRIESECSLDPEWKEYVKYLPTVCK